MRRKRPFTEPDRIKGRISNTRPYIFEMPDDRERPNFTYPLTPPHRWNKDKKYIMGAIVAHNEQDAGNIRYISTSKSENIGNNPFFSPGHWALYWYQK